MQRPSPTESATLFEVGTKKKGNDGNMWIVMETKNGVRRWSLAKPGGGTGGTGGTNGINGPNRRRKYLTHDNGGRPFLVSIGKDVLEIFKKTNREGEDTPVTYDKLIKRYDNIQKVFVGKSPLNRMTGYSGGHGAQFDGNSILVLLNANVNRYVYIGEQIYEFNAPEPITRYYSAVGNSDVPYPVALSKSYVYFMLGPSMHYKEKRRIGGEYVERTAFSPGINWTDAYGEYYKRFPEHWWKDRKGKLHFFDGVKSIHKRIW